MPQCKAQDDPKAIELPRHDRHHHRYVDFFDDVARQVAKVHPSGGELHLLRRLHAAADQWEEVVAEPLRGDRADPPYCRLHEIGQPGCTSRQQEAAMVDGWAAVASRMGYYNYMYNLADGTLPFFKFHACKSEFPYLHSRGVSFMTIEDLTNWHIYGPQIYLSLRLAYNPDASADAIMEDYWLKFYGPSAAPFYEAILDGHRRRRGEKLSSHAGSFLWACNRSTPPSFEKNARPFSTAPRPPQRGMRPMSSASPSTPRDSRARWSTADIRCDGPRRF